MAAKKGFVKKVQGKKPPTRSASWVLKRIKSWQRFHSSIPVKYKVPIVLISGYVVTLIIALILIGAILNLIIDQFEIELQNKGFGGFARLHTINKSIHEDTLAKLMKIDLVSLPAIDEKAIEELPNKLWALERYIEHEDTSYNELLIRINALQDTINQRASPSVLAEYQEKINLITTEITAAERSYSLIERILNDPNQMEELIFNTMVPVNSYHLQCGDQGPIQNGWDKFNAQWQLIRSNEPKYLYLGPLSTNPMSTGPDIFDFFSNLTVKLSSDGPPDFHLSPLSVTQYADGYSIKIRVKEKMAYTPPALVCGLWLRTG